jgi:hypothetical protein
MAGGKPMKASKLLAQCLVRPAHLQTLTNGDVTAVITAARAEKLLATLAMRSENIAVPERLKHIFQDAIIDCNNVQRLAMWEVDRMYFALNSLNIPVVLLKGSAFVAANLTAATGRQVGDLDILVPRVQLEAVEAKLILAGWEWVKDDPYDQQYYRQWMHELPPMIHNERDGMIDVHHTILPLTARPTPDAHSLIDQAITLDSGLFILQPADMICHAAAHLAADGDMAGGMRNLWDVHALLEAFAQQDGFWDSLDKRAQAHQLSDPVARTLRLANRLYGTPIDKRFAGTFSLLDRLLMRRIMARDAWGREAYIFTRFAVYIRSHWLRMPPLMLAKHLWIKWRKGDG